MSCQLWLDLIFKHYFQSGDYELSVLQLTAVSLNNEPIIEAMRHLAKNRDWAARKTLYRLLIDGSFLVPVDENNGTSGRRQDRQLSSVRHLHRPGPFC